MLPVTNSIPIEEESELRRGPWTLEEDTLLTHYIARHGEGRWNMLAKCAGLKRTGKSCRLRWLNYLKPDIKRGNLSPQEQLLILELHSKWGNRWSKIAQHLPGRTDNEIKNYWRTRVQKLARQLNVDQDNKRFLEAYRCFRIQKVEQSSQSSVHSELLNCINPLPNSISENANSVTCTADLMNISEQTGISYICGHSQIVNQTYNIDSYNMDGSSQMGEEEISRDWIGNEMITDGLWNNMDEIWQFREMEDIGN